MVNVKREREDSMPTISCEDDSLHSARKRQKQQHQASPSLSFSIESIMRGGNITNNQSATSNSSKLAARKQQSVETSVNSESGNQALHHVIQHQDSAAIAAAARCGGVESPCSSIRSNGHLSNGSSSSTRQSSPTRLDGCRHESRSISPVSLEDEDRDFNQSPQSRLSSPISPGDHKARERDCKRFIGSSYQQQHQHNTTSKQHTFQQHPNQEHHLSQRQCANSSQRSPSSSGDHAASLQNVECVLENKNDWNRFHSLNTEMIITKTGRRMFPVMKVQFSNLDPNRQYAVSMDIVPVDNKRYRYAYHKSCWQVAGKADPSAEPRLYPHPDSPFMGDLLARQVISFEKVKLTNNEMDKSGHIILNSMHKYQPRIHLIDFGTPHQTNTNTNQNNNYQNLKTPNTNNSKHYQSTTNTSSTSSSQPQQAQRKIDIEGYRTFVFSETVFTAVTAYQNQLITKLKIEKNPFAKGFRDSSRLSDLDRGDAFDYIGHSMGSSGRYLPGMTSSGGLGGPSALEFAAAAASAAGSHMDAYQLLASAAASQNPWYQTQMQQHQQQVTNSNSNSNTNGNGIGNGSGSGGGGGGSGSSTNSNSNNNNNNNNNINNNNPQINPMTANLPQNSSHQLSSSQQQAAAAQQQIQATQLWLAAFSACLNGAGANAAAVAAAAAASGAGTLSAAGLNGVVGGGGGVGGGGAGNNSAAIN